jgi:hypothetical protein
MLFLLRILLIAACWLALGYAALYALGTWVEPERREVIITLPPPKPVP